MKKNAIIYSFNSKYTAKVAEKIQKALGEQKTEMVNVENISPEKFLEYDQLILGSSTWFDGELPNYWDEFIPAIEDMDLKGKTIAIFGLGDQKDYGENFADAVGILARLMKQQGAKIIGKQEIEGFEYERSKAEQDGTFIGLVIDVINQPKLTDKKIEKWVKQLKKEFIDI